MSVVSHSSTGSADSACRPYTNKMVGGTIYNKKKLNFNKEKVGGAVVSGWATTAAAVPRCWLLMVLNRPKLLFTCWILQKLKARTKRKALKLSEVGMHSWCTASDGPSASALKCVWLLLLLLLQKHKEQKVRLMTRSKKNQRKQEHRSRMAEKAQLLLGDQEMADAAGAVVVSSSKGRKKARGKKQAKAASGSDVASAAAEVMQE